MKNFYNYQTFYLGSPGNFERTQAIYLCNSKDLKTEEGNTIILSLSNLDALRTAISGKTATKDGIVMSVREEDGTFIIPLATGRTDDWVPDKWEFDLIIYCDEALRDGIDNPIRGYTLFSESQKTYTKAGNTFNTLIVSVTMVRNEGNSYVTEVTIENYTDVVEYETSKEYWEEQENEPWSYPKEVDEDPASYIRYTERPLDFKRDKTLCILTDSGISCRGDGGELITARLYIYPEIETDSQLYEEYLIGTFNGDLTLLKLNLKDDGIFRICSLSKTNIFGSPYEYRSGQIDLDVIDGWTFLYYSYSYLVFSRDNKRLVYFLEDETYTITEDYVIADSWDPEGKLEYMTAEDLIQEINRTCQKNFEFDYAPKFLRKTGSWWIFLGDDGYNYYSPLGEITKTGELLQVTDRLFLKKNMELLPIEIGQENPKEFPISEAVSDGLRRKPFRRDLSEIPWTNLKSIFGILFYTEGNYLYCY